MSLVVQAVAEHFRVDACAALDRVLAFLDHECGRTFAHHETIAMEIEGFARVRRIAGPPAHRTDEIERTKRERAEWGFGAARDHHVGHAIADVAHRFAYGDDSARTRI